MRALNAQFEFFDAAHVPTDESGMRQGSTWADRGCARRYKNRGNEAKKWLKTKEVTILNAANCAHFRCQFAHIECWKEQRAALQNEARAAGPKRHTRT